VSALLPQPGLVGKRALVTGGTLGIGQAVVELLLASGADVFVVARDARRLEERLATWRSEHGEHRAVGLAMDVTDFAGRAHLFDQLQRRWGALDVLVSNVGTNLRKAAVDYAPAEAAAIFETNLHAAFALSTGAYPLLAVGDAAALVFVLSVAGHTHIPTGAPYAMTKAALGQLVRNLAVEWAPGVRVNAVSPWYTDTPLVRGVLADPAYLERVLRATPVGRIAEPAEIAAPIAFLTSPAASYVTGQTLAVDGGFLARGF